MKQKIGLFFAAKNHTHESLTAEEVFRKRLDKTVFFMIVLVAAFTVNYISLYLLKEQIITLKKLDYIIDTFLFISVLSGVIILPYHPRHYGLNTDRLRFNIIAGTAAGLLFFCIGIGFRYYLFTHGEPEFRFVFVPGRVIRDILYYPVCALAQEILFRGHLQSYFMALFDGRRFKTAISITIPSIIFGQFHVAYGGLPVFAGAFIFSLALGFFYEKTRSVVGVTIIHFFTGAGLFFFSAVIQ